MDRQRVYSDVLRLQRIQMHWLCRVPAFALLICLASLWACGRPGNGSVQRLANSLTDIKILANAPSPLVTPTYDGSGQGMHPGIVAFESAWHGYRYWMAMTPYSNDSDRLENPSILASQDGLNWEVPLGLANPVAPYQPVHQMDPDLLYDAQTDQLWLYHLRGDTGGHTLLLRRTSSDGVHWSDEQVQFAIPYNTTVSPAIDKVGGTYKLWSVNPTCSGCSPGQNQVELRSSTDGVNWTSPEVVNLRQTGYEVWHVEVEWVPAKNEYWALYAAYPDGANTGRTLLFFAKSSDGVNWTTFGRPILVPGSGWDASQIYRSTFLYDESTDMLRVWYSAQHSQVWHTGYTELKYATVLNYLSQP